ncbi:MAG TPA: FtsX-like permease family protein [Saprospiraceae bacterium]|nr:FtsX-like permease family protein [Saprospiraceae bacterium]
MNKKVLLNIAYKHITTRIKQSSIAALGVTFGIATFIILVSFMTGLNGLLDGLILDRTPHIHLYNEIIPSENQPISLSTRFKDDWFMVRSVKPKQNQSRIHNARPIINILKQNPDVLGVSAQVASQAFFTAGNIELNGIINGVNILEESRLFNIDNYIINGSIYDLHNNDNAIIIGIGIAKKMSTKVGDRIQIVNAKGNRLTLKIVALYQSGLAEIDNIQSFANIGTVQRFMGEKENYISDINLKLYDINKALPMSKELSKMYQITAVDIGTANAQFETGTAIRNIITYAVSITLLIVAGFGIYNILNMFIYEKMNDIAILKATGFSGNDVLFIFISEALLIGLMGGLLGLILGYFFSSVIDQLPFETDALPTIKTYPVNFNPIYYVIGIVFAMISTFFAGYLPARKAKRIDPVTILRGQ